MLVDRKCCPLVIFGQPTRYIPGVDPGIKLIGHGRAPARLKFLLATVLGNVKEMWPISLFPLATQVIFGKWYGTCRPGRYRVSEPKG
jgi:hypothetical protein